MFVDSILLIVGLENIPKGAEKGLFHPLGSNRVIRQGGGGKKIRANFFFVPPPPLRGYPPKKKLAPHVGIFFRQEEFLYCLLLELECHLHFATL